VRFERGPEAGGRNGTRRNASKPCRKGDTVMKAWIKNVKSFLRDEEGATAVEYAVMLALIIVVALGAITALGTKVSTTFANITTAMP
jgi:pilus assembly protein Flp/PilA